MSAPTDEELQVLERVELSDDSDDDFTYAQLTLDDEDEGGKLDEDDDELEDEELEDEELEDDEQEQDEQEQGLDPRKTLFAGDMKHDIETAKFANLLAVGTLTGYNSREQLNDAGPDILVDNLSALVECI